MKKITTLTFVVVALTVWVTLFLLLPFLKMLQQQTDAPMPPPVLFLLQPSTVTALAGIITALLLFAEYRIPTERWRFVGQIVALAVWIAAFCGCVYLLFAPIWPMKTIQEAVPNHTSQPIAGKPGSG